MVVHKSEKCNLTAMGVGGENVVCGSERFSLILEKIGIQLFSSFMFAGKNQGFCYS